MYRISWNWHTPPQHVERVIDSLSCAYGVHLRWLYQLGQFFKSRIVGYQALGTEFFRAAFSANDNRDTFPANLAFVFGLLFHVRLL